jgi:hypothetical protein
MTLWRVLRESRDNSREHAPAPSARWHRVTYLKNGIIFFRIGDVMPKSRKLFKL